MDGYITLLGTEEITRAARIIQSAANDMNQAASFMEDSLFRHRQWADEWLARFEAATNPTTGTPEVVVGEEPKAAKE